MNFSWIKNLFRAKLRIEGRRSWFSHFEETEAWRKTMRILEKNDYSLQFLDEYVADFPDKLLTPLTSRHERSPACSIVDVLGTDEESFRERWRGIASYEMRSDLVASLPNASLWGYPFFVLTEERVLLRDSSWDFKIYRKAKDRPAVTRKIEGRAVILPLHRCRNYYHWIAEVLPRVKMLVEAGLWGRIPVIVPPLQTFQRESLIALGLKDEWMIAFDPDRDHFEIEEAVYPSRLGANRKISSNSVDWMRNRFAPCVIQGKRRIYYSRSASVTRKIINENDFLPELKKRGFEIFTGENLSFYEQVALFAEAEIVIGAHGAGMTNVLFCRADVPVLEMFSSDYVNPCFAELCDSGRNPYSLMIGESQDKGDYRVDAAALLGWIDQTLSSKK